MFSSKSIRLAYSRHLIAAHRECFTPMPFIRFVRTVAYATKVL